MQFPDALLMQLTVQERAEFVGRLLSSNALEVIGEAVLIKTPPPDSIDKANQKPVDPGFNLRSALARLMAHLCGDTSRPLLWAQREVATDHHVEAPKAVPRRRRLYAITM